jgi:CheY-like chemotaxis protein
MSEAGASPKGILVVDDDADAAQTFAYLLRQLGHAVDYVTSPQLGLDVAKSMRPWLIFLDIAMPEMSGWELAQLLRRELGHEKVRLIAVTGRGEPEDHKRSREAGFDAHVQKPVDLHLLQSILAQLN